MRWLKLLKHDIGIEPFLSNSKGLSQNDVFRDKHNTYSGLGKLKNE